MALGWVKKLLLLGTIIEVAQVNEARVFCCLLFGKADSALFAKVWGFWYCCHSVDSTRSNTWKSFSSKDDILVTHTRCHTSAFWVFSTKIYTCYVRGVQSTNPIHWDQHCPRVSVRLPGSDQEVSSGLNHPVDCLDPVYPNLYHQFSCAFRSNIWGNSWKVNLGLFAKYI